ncbi:MAG: DNA repair protein RadA, partial [Actinobacteria bacterium]|nr:DNA repair protein RadA [Actinomycetota bacterium]
MVTRASGTRTSSHGGFDCRTCGYEAARWFGRCPECGAWSTAATRAVPSLAPPAAVASLAKSDGAPERRSTGIAEVDRVLGGGLVDSSVVLLAGEPGIGKSTLVLQILAGAAAEGRSALLVTGEESIPQVALRARRIGAATDGIRVARATTLEEVLNACATERPELLVVDSIQTLEDSSVESAPGSVTQVRECAAALVAHAKATETVIVIVGHVTKDGGVAGPKTLEHVVDVVVALEGERHEDLRLLRVSKNRFGSCAETGVFVMNASGLDPVEDPSGMMLGDRRPGIAGSVVFPSLEGTRPVLVEIQALVTPTKLVPPRRVALGVDARRLTLMLGVLSKSQKVRFGDHDVFVAVTGGLAVREPAGDLALCLALLSAIKEVRILPGIVAFGEVGLGGEVRRVPGPDRRLSESARLGFDAAIVPAAC